MSIETMIRERGLQKQWVADQIGVDAASFSRMLKGRKPWPADKLKPLAKALRFPIVVVRKEIASLNGGGK